MAHSVDQLSIRNENILKALRLLVIPKVDNNSLVINGTLCIFLRFLMLKQVQIIFFAFPYTLTVFGKNIFSKNFDTQVR